MENIERKILTCYEIYKNYEWLLDSYVLDFFTKNHWDTLPESWKIFLDNIEMDQLGYLLNNEHIQRVLPLSLAALKSLQKQYTLPRVQIKLKDFIKEDIECKITPKFERLFWRNVKLKKRHEIDILASMCYNYSKVCGCEYIIDIGGGLGHLSRLLTYGYGLKVCNIEAQMELTKQAVHLDLQFESFLKKQTSVLNCENKPVHINMKIDSNTTPEMLIKLIKESFNIHDDNFNVGVIGLHPCGDLGPILLKLYNNSPQISFLNIIGCCYMKLSTPSMKSPHGFPMSSFCTQSKFDLSYSAREVACHAIENYVKKLKTGTDNELKVHAYRALLEKLVVSTWPHLQHFAIGNIKYCDGLTFLQYCEKALVKYKVELDSKKLCDGEIEEHLKQWPRVVKYYVIRLMLAPLIETIILYDRILYLQERGSKCALFAAFDPMLSPRNHVLIATKNR